MYKEFILATAWFERTWIRQEIFASTNLHFQLGPHKFQLRALQSSPFRPDIKTLDIILAKDTTHNDPPITPWLNVVLQNTEGFKTTMDQDIIFGLQNIVEGERRSQDRLLPVADYTNSAPALFQDWAKRLTQNTGVPYFLMIFEDRSTPSSPDLPSWLPDLSIKKQRALFTDETFILQGKHKLTWDPDVENSPIVLEGAVLATFKERAMHPAPMQLSPTEKFARAVQYAAPEDRRSLPKILTGYHLKLLLDDFKYIEYDSAYIRPLYNTQNFVPATSREGDLLVTPTAESMIFYLLRPEEEDDDEDDADDGGEQKGPLRCRFVGPCLSFGVFIAKHGRAMHGLFGRS